MSTTSTSAQVPKLRFPGFEGALKHITLSDVCNGDISNGVFNDPDKQDGAYRLINVLDMFGTDRVDVRKLSLLSLGKKEFEKNKVKYGDIFFTRSSLVASGIAWSNVFLDHDENVTFDGHLMKISPDLDQYDPACLAQYFRSTPVRRQLIRRGKTGTMTPIGQDDISSVELEAPTLPEPQKIAAFLTAVDGRIEQLSRKKALLEATKKGVMQQLFTQTLRFQDDHGHDFPDWEEAEFKEIAAKSSAKYDPAGSESELKCVELESISQGTGELLELFVSTDQKSIKNRFKRGEVLFGKLRPYLRKWLLAPFDGVCSSEIWVLRGRKVTNAFLYHLVQSEQFMREANVSSGSKMPRADWDHLSASAFAYPPSENEQTKIASFLSALDGKIGAVGEQMRQTQAWKKGLQQQMFV